MNTSENHGGIFQIKRAGWEYNYRLDFLGRSRNSLHLFKQPSDPVTDVSNCTQKMTRTTDISTAPGFRGPTSLHGATDTKEQKEVAITPYPTRPAPFNSMLPQGRSTANIPNNVFLSSWATDPTESFSDMTTGTERNLRFSSPVDITPGSNVSERTSVLKISLSSPW